MIRYLPILTGCGILLIASAVSGFAGAVWYAVGVFMGGWLPLYLMPWLRDRAKMRKMKKGLR